MIEFLSIFMYTIPFAVYFLLTISFGVNVSLSLKKGSKIFLLISHTRDIQHPVHAEGIFISNHVTS
jgi:hypothetical protein